MNLIFAGTPVFAAVALEALLDAGHQVSLVLTQPDRPAGRGLKSQSSAVKQLALVRQLEIAQPPTLRDETFIGQLQRLGADVMVVAAYGLMIPSSLLVMPQLGCLNIHASLLPRWRGAAPIQRAILAGDCETGVTIMQMDAGLDTGDMLLTGKVRIAAEDSTESLHDKLAELGGRMVVEALEMAACGGLRPVKQPEDGITYAHKIEKHEAAIDWSQGAATIERRIRAFTPFPGAFGQMDAEAIKFREAVVLDTPTPQGAAPGQVLAANESGVDIATANGVLRVTRLQKAGGKPLPAGDFLRGFAIQPGAVFAQPEPVKP